MANALLPPEPVVGFADGIEIGIENGNRELLILAAWRDLRHQTTLTWMRVGSGCGAGRLSVQSSAIASRTNALDCFYIVINECNGHFSPAWPLLGSLADRMKRSYRVSVKPRTITLGGLRIVWAVLLLGVILFVSVTEKFHPSNRQINQTIYAALCLAAIWLIGAIFRIRRVSAKRFTGASTIDDSKRLRAAYAVQLILMACAFAIVQYGVLGRFMGATPKQTIPFYIAGTLLLLYFKPKEISTGASGLPANVND